MTRRTDQIGFSQRVRLEWLEQTANLVLAGNDKAAVNDALQELLKDKVSVGGQAERGNREKIITILLKTWLTVPADSSRSASKAWNCSSVFLDATIWPSIGAW